MTIPRHVLCGFTALLLMATQGQSQPDLPNSPGRRGGQGSDLSRLYGFLFEGKDVVNREELDPPRQKIFDLLAKKLGVTTGQITRAQIDGLPSMPKANRPVTTPPVPPASAASAGGERPSYRVTASHVEAQAEAGDRRYDRGGAGQPGPLAPTVPATNAVLVYHSDNLPKELPDWFRQLDTNHDAQIGLYEWKVSGRSIAEFQRMDRNNDGFLTVEEVLAYLAQTGQLGAAKGKGARSAGVAQATATAGYQRGQGTPNRVVSPGQTGR